MKLQIMQLKPKAITETLQKRESIVRIPYTGKSRESVIGRIKRRRKRKTRRGIKKNEKRDIEKPQDHNFHFCHIISYILVHMDMDLLMKIWICKMVVTHLRLMERLTCSIFSSKRVVRRDFIQLHYSQEVMVEIQEIFH